MRQGIKNMLTASHNSNLANETGLHDLLFFLKSLDLDLQCGFKMFTTFDYNYADFMK